MEALKQKRTTLRSTFTRSANSLDALLTAAQANSADIEVIYEQLFERFKNLKDCDIRVLDLLQKDKKAQGVDVLRFTDPGTKFKLPNIELPTFDGNPRDWLNFWTRWTFVPKAPGSTPAKVGGFS
ncbi:uncharacterized protein TNCV_3653411 [Trichonephila clavipes]|nr:uncharacterized protein TNCV_3653411 [Trichonephila clavipes]